jgi:hypothetical protein
MIPDSPTSSTLSISPPTLRSDTLSALNSFLSSRAEVEEQFQALVDKRTQNTEEADSSPLSVDEFRRLFGEDWQKSQFWCVWIRVHSTFQPLR